MTPTPKLPFNAAPLPYRLRNGEFALVERQAESTRNWYGHLIPSELKSSWDQLGRDLDGNPDYDLMELVRPNTPDHQRLRGIVERLLKTGEPTLAG